MWRLSIATRHSTFAPLLLFLVSGMHHTDFISAMTNPKTMQTELQMTSTTPTTMATNPNSNSNSNSNPNSNSNSNQHNNVLISSARLVPFYGSTTVAHQTKDKVFELLEETMARRNQHQNDNNCRNEREHKHEREHEHERAMIVDISATTWNWDTYAIVAGTIEPIRVVFPTKDDLLEHLSFAVDGNNNGEPPSTVQKGVLVPQQQQQPQPPGTNHKAASTSTMVWVPKGSVLTAVHKRDNTEDNTDSHELFEFVLTPPIDPNNDRLEHWEQQVVGETTQRLRTRRARLAHECMRNMLRFYDLDRIVCWDLSWGVWEAVRDRNDNGNSNGDGNGNGDGDGDGFPIMTLVKDGKDSIPAPSFDGTGDNDEKAIQLMYDYARPITPALLADTLKSVSGYYLVGGNTYTMSLFHHMWDQQDARGEGSGGGVGGGGDTETKTKTETKTIGHMQLLRNLLAEGTLFYLGHSAGAIMSGPNILTATFKGIDAFSIVTQPYNAPYVKLPPSESPDTFFVCNDNDKHDKNSIIKNNLVASRTQMLAKMNEYGAWRGYHVVEALAFPHYDSRPRFASFPQSAESYLRATDDRGRFCQPTGSLLVGTKSNNDSNDECNEYETSNDRAEPADVRVLREETNQQELPCYPIANGHAMVLSCGGLEVVTVLSPEEEGGGTLHWDTYMPNVPDTNYLQYAPKRTRFTAGSFTRDANTLPGDRSSSSSSGYNGARILSRLEALGLPYPTTTAGSTTTNSDATNADTGGLFRS